MKKFLSLFLAIVMVFAITINVFAEGETKYFKIGETEYATLTEALTAANEADGPVTIEMLADCTEEFNSQQPYKFTNAITLNGGGYTLTFVSAAANQFAINVEAADKVVTIKNFETITATVGGGIAVTAGTLNLEDVKELSATGRAALKTQNNGAEGAKAKAINVTNSEVKLTANASTTEAAMILSGNQDSTLTLNAGAIIQKDIASNNKVSDQASVIYFADGGNHSIVMNEGSMIWASHASGTSASCIGLGSGSGTNTITINEGAFLYAGSNVTDFYFFGESASRKTTITAWDGAFAVGTEATLKGFVLLDAAGKYYDCTYEAMDEEGYKLVKTEKTEMDFEVDGVAMIGTFTAALNAAKDGSTIKVLRDYASSTDKNIALSGKNIVLDLNGCTLNITADAYFISELTSTLTIKNGTFKAARGITVKAGGHLIFDGVTAISSDGTGSNSRALVKLSAGTCKLTVKNSTLETKTTIGEPFILSEGSSNGTIDLLENAVLKYSGNLGSHEQNHSVISNQGSATLTVNVSSTAKLIAAQQHNGKTNIAAILCQDAGGTVVINLEKGATLVADRVSGSSATKVVHDKTPDTGSITVNDKGANYVICADVAKKGIVLPANAYGYKMGDEVVTLADGNVYQNASATEAVTLTAISYDFKPVMMTGAAIFLEKPMGMRFGATIDAETYAKILELDPNAEFGFYVAKKGNAGTKFDVDNMLASNYQKVVAKGSVAGGVFTFEADIFAGEDSIISNDRTGYKQQTSARAYVKLTINGEEVIYLAEFDSDNNTRSMYNVAKAYVADTVDGSTTNVVANYIIAVCDAKK